MVHILLTLTPSCIYIRVGNRHLALTLIVFLRQLDPKVSNTNIQLSNSPLFKRPTDATYIYGFVMEMVINWLVKLREVHFSYFSLMVCLFVELTSSGVYIFSI